MSSTRKQITQLYKNLTNNTSATQNIKTRNNKKINIGFINQFSKHKFIPNLWFDWKRENNASIIIVGQDWGPYKELKKIIQQYKKEKENKNFNYNSFLVKTFSSRTEDFIIKESKKLIPHKSNQDFIAKFCNSFIFSVAIMFTRQGTHFRGNKYYDEKFGLKHSIPYLKKQLQILKPQAIMPLGGTAWEALQEIYNLNNYPSQITKIVKKDIIIKTKNIDIIPNFHPASHTSRKVQSENWQKLKHYLFT